MQQREKFPEEAKPFLDVPNLVTTIDLSINFSNPGPTALIVHANDAASAERLMQLYDLLKQLQRKQLNVETQRMLTSEDAIERAFGQYLERVSDVASDAYKIQRHDDSLILFELPKFDASPSNQLTQIAVIGILVALLLPAVQAAREAARRNVSLSQLKQIILAMLVYADAKRTFPPHAIYSADGKPLLSWRVAILPYLEHQELYNQFKLDEPWDSPHNRQLLPHMPDVYANPNIAEPGWTNYLAVVGPQCVLDGTQKGVGLAQIEDGTSNTIVVVEADIDRAVEWTKPDDIAFDPNNPHAGFGKLRPGGSNVVWADGHASFLPVDAPPDLVKAFITRSGGERVAP
jgi:prepilin-type processing-associated H-X9-DG protein